MMGTPSEVVEMKYLFDVSEKRVRRQCGTPEGSSYDTLSEDHITGNTTLFSTFN
jgi:hypothetical protein